MLPSAAVRLDDGTLVAWGFMGESGVVTVAALRLTSSFFTPGLDGSMITGHVKVGTVKCPTVFDLVPSTDIHQEPYRRLGLATVLGRRLTRKYLPKYGDDGWVAADVVAENHVSQALCQRVGGGIGWRVSW